MSATSFTSRCREFRGSVDEAIAIYAPAAASDA